MRILISGILVLLLMPKTMTAQSYPTIKGPDLEDPAMSLSDSIALKQFHKSLGCLRTLREEVLSTQKLSDEHRLEHAIVESYVDSMDDAFSKYIKFLAENLRYYHIMVPHFKPSASDPFERVYALENSYLKSAVAQFLLDYELLNDCAYFDLSDEQVNAFGPSPLIPLEVLKESLKESLIRGITDLFKSSKDQLNVLLKSDINECYRHNLQIIQDRLPKK